MDSDDSLFLDSDEDIEDMEPPTLAGEQAGDQDEPPAGEQADDEPPPHEDIPYCFRCWRNCPWDRHDICAACVSDVNDPQHTYCYLCSTRTEVHDDRYACAACADQTIKCEWCDEDDINEASRKQPYVATLLTGDDARDLRIIATDEGLRDGIVNGLLYMELECRTPQQAPHLFFANNIREGGEITTCPLYNYLANPTGHTYTAYTASIAPPEPTPSLTIPLCIFCNRGRQHPNAAWLPADVSGPTRCVREGCACNNDIFGIAPNEVNVGLPLQGWDELVALLQREYPHRAELRRKVIALRGVMVEQVRMVVEWQVAHERAYGARGTIRPSTTEYFAIWHFLSTQGIGEGLKLVWRLKNSHLGYPRGRDPSEWWKNRVGEDVAYGLRYFRENVQRARWEVPQANVAPTLKLLATRAFAQYLRDTRPELEAVINPLLNQEHQEE